MKWSPSRIAGVLRRNFRLWSADMTRSPDQFDAIVRLSLAVRRARYEELQAQRRQTSAKILAGLEPFDFSPAMVLPLTIRTARKWLVWKIFSSIYRAGLSAELGPGNYIVSMNIVAAARAPA